MSSYINNNNKLKASFIVSFNFSKLFLDSSVIILNKVHRIISWLRNTLNNRKNIRFLRQIFSDVHRILRSTANFSNPLIKRIKKTQSEKEFIIFCPLLGKSWLKLRWFCIKVEKRLKKVVIYRTTWATFRHLHPKFHKLFPKKPTLKKFLLYPEMELSSLQIKNVFCIYQERTCKTWKWKMSLSTFFVCW